MSPSLILILIGIVSVGSVLGIIYFKLKKAKKDRNQNVILKKQKNSTIKIQREKQKIEKQKEEIKTNINNADPDNLASAYDDQLQNMPTPKRSRD